MRRVRGLSRISLSYNTLPPFSADASIYVSFSPLYWLCERFNGHFFGLHSGYGEYNISGVRIPFLKKSVKDHRYQGWATGLGISYGYSWLLGRRWNLEATVGAGYVYTNYDRYECATCGKFRGTGDRHYFGPTKAGISIIYIID